MSHTKNIYDLLFEKENKETDSPEKPLHLKKGKLKSRKSLYSIDNQIDALILGYEASSIRKEDEQLSGIDESLHERSLKFLFEQEDPLEALAGEEDEGSPAAEEDTKELGGDSEDTSKPTGSEKMEDLEPEVALIPDLDVDAFTNKAVRLITNYDKLLNIKASIVNRIKNFLDENYGDEFVIRFIETLKNEYGIEMTEFDESELIQTSNDAFAPGANSAATGSG